MSLDSYKVNHRYSYKPSDINYHINTEEEIQSWVYGPPVAIPPHPGFELRRLPDGVIKKLAYGELYHADTEDLEIEFAVIRKLEEMQYLVKKDLEREEIKEKDAEEKFSELRENLKFHYKQAISILSPKFSKGWNRWSDDILELFVDEKMHRVLWGSGNCGKSAVTGLLLYTKWRVNPLGRMVVLAAKVLKESEERVAGYIKEIHMEAPPSKVYKFAINPSNKNSGIYCLVKDKHSGKMVPGDRSCIVHLPVKINKKDSQDLVNIVASHAGGQLEDSLFLSDVGGNLLGKHPDDRLILAFDEAQEIPGVILRSRIFSNWYTNEKIDVLAWGNPAIVNISCPEEQDLLFKLGAGNLVPIDIRRLEHSANTTGWWWWSDTKVLHLTMLDSPKEDQDEVDWTRYTGKERLTFLAGRSNVERIKARTKENSPSWFAQVLGFPYLVDASGVQAGVLTPQMIVTSREYPLMWANEDACQWFMGIDPSVTGNYDKAAVCIGRMGMMVDGRMGVDLMNGRFSETIEPVDNKNFTDVAVDRIYELSKKHKISLRNISLEAHGTGEVFRYAMQKHIESGEKPQWSSEYADGQRFYIINPMQKPTDRYLFKDYNIFEKAENVVATIVTEYWVAIRCAVISRQIFNIPEKTLQQFYSRYLDKIQNGTRFRIEPKSSLRKRGISSPNEADALTYMFDLMRERGFSFQYYGRFGYEEVYGEEYYEKQKQLQVERQLERIGGMLGFGRDLVVAGRGWDKPKRPKADMDTRAGSKGIRGGRVTLADRRGGSGSQRKVRGGRSFIEPDSV